VCPRIWCRSRGGVASPNASCSTGYATTKIFSSSTAFRSTLYILLLLYRKKSHLLVWVKRMMPKIEVKTFFLLSMQRTQPRRRRLGRSLVQRIFKPIWLKQRQRFLERTHSDPIRGR
jgi:hypothetical protein